MPPAAKKYGRPVLLELGYKELAQIACNAGSSQAKYGVLLGGHGNNDIFIACHCTACHNLPYVMAEEGGCIWTCSPFERHAGLGHRKKWKESIRYVETERRILDFIKDSSAALGGEAMIGQAMWVCQPRDLAFHLCIVKAWDAKEGKYQLQYRDGSVKYLYLGIELHQAATYTPTWATGLPAAPPLATYDFPPKKVSRFATAVAEATVRGMLAVEVDYPVMTYNYLQNNCDRGTSNVVVTAGGPKLTRKREREPCTQQLGIQERYAACEACEDGKASLPAQDVMLSRAAQRQQHEHHAFDILNAGQVARQWPSLQLDTMRWDLKEWLALPPEHRLLLTAQRVGLQHGDGQLQAYAKQALYRHDLLGELPGSIRVAGEVLREGAGLSDGVRLFESTTKGQHNWAQELCLDARHSTAPLGRVRQVAHQAKACVNVVILEVEQHAPHHLDMCSTVHQIAVLTQDVAPGTPLVTLRTKACSLSDKGLPVVPMAYPVLAPCIVSLSPLRFLWKGWQQPGYREQLVDSMWTSNLAPVRPGSGASQQSGGAVPPAHPAAAPLAAEKSAEHGHAMHATGPNTSMAQQTAMEVVSMPCTSGQQQGNPQLQNSTWPRGIPSLPWGTTACTSTAAMGGQQAGGDTRTAPEGRAFGRSRKHLSSGNGQCARTPVELKVQSGIALQTAISPTGLPAAGL